MVRIWAIPTDTGYLVECGECGPVGWVDHEEEIGGTVFDHAQEVHGTTHVHPD